MLRGKSRSTRDNKITRDKKSSRLRILIISRTRCQISILTTDLDSPLNFASSQCVIYFGQNLDRSWPLCGIDRTSWSRSFFSIISRTRCPISILTTDLNSPLNSASSQCVIHFGQNLDRSSPLCAIDRTSWSRSFFLNISRTPCPISILTTDLDSPLNSASSQCVIYFGKNLDLYDRVRIYRFVETQ